MTLLVIFHCLLISDNLINPQQVSISQNTGQIGAIGLYLDRHDLLIASQSRPLLIRYRLPGNFSLKETLVDLESSPSQNQPISLALLSPNSGDHQVVCPAETIQIIRWRAGESEIWPQVQAHSGEWVSDQDGASYPNNEQPVVFAIGISSTVSQNHSEPFEQVGKANLPANALWNGMTWTPTSTKIEVNYDSTGAEPYTPIIMTSHYFYDSLGVRSAPSPNGIVLGTVPGIALPSTFKIAIWVP